MFVDMPISQIDRNPGQPRRVFDAQALTELAASIAANGLLEPIVVRPVGSRCTIVAGERRWRASQEAGLLTVPVRVMDLNEADAYVLSVAENVNRSDMNVMEEAEAFEQLQRFGRDDTEIARLFGKSLEYVRIRLSFLDLVPEARGLVEAGTMGPWLARYVARLRPGNQRVVTARWARGEFEHETAASEFAAALQAAEEQAGFFELEEPTLEQRAVHAKKARQVRSAAEQVERLSALLSELAKADPGDVAAALGNDVAARLAAIEDVAKLAGKARLVMRKAKMHAEARSLVVAEEVVA